MGALVLSSASLGVAQSVLQQPLESLAFAPTQIAVAPDGSFYVADEATESIRRFTSAGDFLGAFDSPTKGTTNSITGLAIDSLGAVHATWTTVDDYGRATQAAASGLASYSATGDLLHDRRYTGHGLSGVVVGPNDQLVVVGPRIVASADVSNVLTPIVQRPTDAWRDILYGADNQLYVRRDDSSAAVDVYDMGGVLNRSFSIENTKINNELVRGFSFAPNGFYVTDDVSGTIRNLSPTGELLNTGYAVPFATDLAIGQDGSLLATMPQNRLVESIDAERFNRNYVGVTTLNESARELLQGPNRLWNEFDVSTGWEETTASTFLVPGEPGEMVDLTFRFLRGQSSLVAVFPVAEVAADPINEPMAYWKQAFDAAYTTLNLSRGSNCAFGSDPNGCGDFNDGIVDTITVGAGVEIGFLEFETDRSTNFSPHGTIRFLNYRQDMNPAAQSIRASTYATLEKLSAVDEDEYLRLMSNARYSYVQEGTAFVFPNASDARANWGHLDQFAFLQNEEWTLMAMEDLSLAGANDLSYHDSLVLIDSKLIPVFEPSGGIVGDYNVDGVVDAADYTVWRDNVGAAYLPNRRPATVGPIGERDYQVWADHYGRSRTSSATHAIPEPAAAAALLCLLGIAIGAARRKN
ncbi:hypothetical protein K2D_03690 [Planctomycetes bacterium K2D]|uniref:PEP-CTERM protein-sorting domain-containing protein n=1 Tax=Botrimarina mediterranea TaxID=2528022 RepID=A0A518K368_9BACT|nr:hypothetical protein Spa11_04160 [Botrimarina mediterranea]QDV76787.1 hypothetical protein K2D_03690 [Planctomycetes bacterium K2D]